MKWFFSFPLALAALGMPGPSAVWAQSGESGHADKTKTQAGSKARVQRDDDAALETVTVSGSVSASANAVASSVATRLPAGAMETPYTITSVGQQLIERSTATRLSDVMRYAATVGGTDNFGNAGEFFSSRGFRLAAGSNYFRDGMRYRKYGQVPLYDIERIEFLRGPASVLYGALEPGGVVNIVSKKPQKDFGASARLKLGQRNWRQVQADITGPASQRLRYRVQALHERADSFRDLVSSRGSGLSGQLELDVSAATRLTLRASWYDDRRTGDRGTVLARDAAGRVGIAPLPRSRFLGERYTVYDFSDFNLFAGLEHAITPRWQLRANVAHSRQKEDRVFMWFVGANSIVGPDGLLRRRVGDWHASLRGVLGRLEVRGQFDTGAFNHRLLAGMEFERFTNRRTNFIYETHPINIYRPVYSATRPPNGKPVSRQIYADRFDSHGFYVQDMLAWGDTLTFLAGLRFDQVKSKDPDRHTARDHARGVTPQLGIVFHPAPWVSPYVSYARSFKPQSGTDRFGKRFEPQKGRQWEAGIKFDWPDAKTFLTLAAYRLERFNLKMTDPQDPAYSRLSGMNRSKGLEAALHTRPMRGLDVTLNYAFTQARYVRDNAYSGKTLTDVPRHALGAFADWQLPGGWSHWAASLGLTYVGKRQGMADNSFQLPAYTLIDAGLRRSLGRQLTLTVNVKNLFDRTWYANSINTSSIGVGAPRTFFMGLEFRL